MLFEKKKGKGGQNVAQAIHAFPSHTVVVAVKSGLPALSTRTKFKRALGSIPPKSLLGDFQTIPFQGLKCSTSKRKQIPPSN